MRKIEAFVDEVFARSEPVTYIDLQDFIHKEFGLDLLPDTVRHLVYSSNALKTVQGVPMEKNRLQCDPSEVDRFYELLDSDLQGIPSSLVFNLDESGFDEWADRAECRELSWPRFPKNQFLCLSHDKPRERHYPDASLLMAVAWFLMLLSLGKPWIRN